MILYSVVDRCVSNQHRSALVFLTPTWLDSPVVPVAIRLPVMDAMAPAFMTPCFFMPWIQDVAPASPSPPDSDAEFDGMGVPASATLLTLRRPLLIHVLEFCSHRKDKMTAARLSVLHDVQLCQLAVIAVGLKRAQQPADTLGVRTFNGFKHMMKAIAIEGPGLPSLDGSWLEEKSRELGFDDSICLTARKRLRRYRSTTSAASTVAEDVPGTPEAPVARRRLRCKTTVHA